MRTLFMSFIYVLHQGIENSGKISYNEDEFEIIFTLDKPIMAQSTTIKDVIKIFATENIKDKKGNFLKKKIYNIYLLKSDIADWKSYRDEIYGFEFRYPIEWPIEMLTDEEESRAPAGDRWEPVRLGLINTISLSVDLVESFSIDEFIKLKNEERDMIVNEIQLDPSKIEKINFGGKSAFRIVYSEPDRPGRLDEVYIFVPFHRKDLYDIGDFVLEINFLKGYDENHDFLNEKFFSTFKFID